ncbi:MAG: hypothetical protein ACK40H_08195 [Sphingomonadaceae bacterium]|jgi:hypothetical protein
MSAPRPDPEQARHGRAVALAVALGAFALLIYLITVVRLQTL